MCIVVGGQICSILQVISSHLWLDLSLDFKVNCWGAIMLIGSKSRHNHYLILCFLHQFKKKEFYLENKLMFLHIFKFNILFYNFLKYEIISLTFGPSKVV